jgi:hypothetical protein
MTRFALTSTGLRAGGVGGDRASEPESRSPPAERVP